MKYYKIINEIEPKITGVKGGESQINVMVEPYDYNAHNSVRQITGISLELDFEPDLNVQLLRKRAKITDMISSERINSLACKLFSERFIEFLTMFNLPKYKTYLAPMAKGVKEGYRWYHSHYLFMLIETANTLIDFKQSEFVLKPSIYDPNIAWIQVEVGNCEELYTYLQPRLFKKGAKRIHATKIVFRPEMKFDMIRLHRLDGYFVSEHLKNMIQQEGYTGMRFELAENIQA